MKRHNSNSDITFVLMTVTKISYLNLKGRSCDASLSMYIIGFNPFF